jgi:hypothetical protein
MNQQHLTKEKAYAFRQPDEYRINDILKEEKEHFCSTPVIESTISFYLEKVLYLQGFKPASSLGF